MGRPEKPLDPATSPVALFAHDLRRLREKAGTPTYRSMSSKAHVSTSALSTAASGDKLPSLAVCLAYVHACGGDVEAWRARWHQANDLVRTEDNDGAGHQASTASEKGHGRRRYRRWQVLAAGAAVVLATGAWAMSSASGDPPRPTHATPATQSPGHRIRDGQDPYVAGCGRDQMVLEQRPIHQSDGSTYGSVALFYSRYCAAAWGYVFGPNSPRLAVHITARRIEDGAAAPSMFRGKARNNSWGNVLSTRTGCVRAEAWVNNGPHAITSCWRPNGPVAH
ncbi:MAG TPA: hypothetical protein VF069_05645 [Streptosporangiaceae bacterium]